MQILLTIISCLFAGGISSLVTISAVRRKGNAEATDLEEQAEAKTIQNVMALTSIQEVNDYDYTAGYPEKLNL